MRIFSVVNRFQDSQWAGAAVVVMWCGMLMGLLLSASFQPGSGPLNRQPLVMPLCGPAAEEGLSTSDTMPVTTQNLLARQSQPGPSETSGAGPAFAGRE
jgi:hypothetical protein